MSNITVYSRQGCHLCEDALSIVRDLAGATHSVEVIDIDADPALTDDYTIRVPVIEVDGVEIAQYQLDPFTLERALTPSPLTG